MCKQGGNAAVTYCLQAPLLILSILRSDHEPWARLSWTHKGTTLKNFFSCIQWRSSRRLTHTISIENSYVYKWMISSRILRECKQATPRYTCTACLRDDVCTQALDIFQLGKDSAPDFGGQVIIQSLDTLWHSIILETSLKNIRTPLLMSTDCPYLAFQIYSYQCFFDCIVLHCPIHTYATCLKHTSLCSFEFGRYLAVKMRLQCVPMTATSMTAMTAVTTSTHQHEHGAYHPCKFTSKIWKVQYIIGK